MPAQSQPAQVPLTPGSLPVGIGTHRAPLAAPFFGLNAKIEMTPVMHAEDL
jgi:hypothetical protein